MSGPVEGVRRVNVLGDILASKRREVEAMAPRATTGGARSPERRTAIDVVRVLRRGAGEALRLVAEVKLRSPSAGPLSRALAPDARAVVYAEAGAAMVSVLADAPFFDGSWADVQAARTKLDAAGAAGRTTPVLAKEFVVHARQIEEAADRGADAVLLIARVVSPTELARLAEAARREEIEPLIEVIDEAELAAAMAAGARVVGVNARDLDTLAMDPARTARVLEAIPKDVVAVHLSGLRDAASIQAVARGRADAALLGEALMRQDDPRSLLAELVRAARV